MAKSFLNSLSLFWYTILLAAPVCTLFAVSVTLQSDIQILHSIKEAIDPNSLSPTSFLSTWKFDLDPCETTGPHFLGILCTVPEDNSSSRVTVIDLEGDVLEGFLTPAIGNLSELEVLNLRKNKFRGPIPDTISSLLKLTKLLLSDNYFSGGIPEGLNRLKALEDIDMSRNKLSGTISLGITGLRSLTHLSFSGNSLSGRIPDLSGLWQLKTLDLSNNQFYGNLPQLPISLRTLRLNRNLISGHISYLRRLRHLQILDLSDNRFSGSIDRYLLTLPEISTINVSANVFTDIVVMSRLDQHSQLQLLAANHNRLHGHLPVNLITYESLKEIYLGHNLFSGWIPKQFGAKLDGPWRSLFLEYNYLEGTPPLEFIQGRRKIRGSLAHNCLKCPGNVTFCHGGQRAPGDCAARGGGGEE
ncbi:OLC1v1019290C1 [Oldenlandia corymbosa var. corymbosa]|uniref:OLC1v1019290C1 n=1 Tax=Oldenlandia corymbosa var. corymbosa TaxID=529605 RepID=A0AAV1EDR3_OLDCO|nr:OLC1v1019290C1 [Oldenlandia corymbosa var. corymbosa]